MTAALLGWTTFMILDGKGMASRVEERRATAALLGGRVSWTTAALLDGRKLNDGCPAWGGDDCYDTGWERVGRRLPDGCATTGWETYIHIYTAAVST